MIRDKKLAAIEALVMSLDYMLETQEHELLQKMPSYEIQLESIIAVLEKHVLQGKDSDILQLFDLHFGRMTEALERAAEQKAEQKDS